MVVGSIGSILNIFHGCTLWLSMLIHLFGTIFHWFQSVKACIFFFWLNMNYLYKGGEWFVFFFGILKRHKRDKIEGKVGLKIMKKIERQSCRTCGNTKTTSYWCIVFFLNWYMKQCLFLYISKLVVLFTYNFHICTLVL